MDTVDELMVFSTARLADETAVSFCKRKKKIHLSTLIFFQKDEAGEPRGMSVWIFKSLPVTWTRQGNEVGRTNSWLRARQPLLAADGLAPSL